MKTSLRYITLFLIAVITSFSCSEEVSPVIQSPPTARLLVGQMSPTLEPATNVEVYTSDVTWGASNRKANLGFGSTGVTNPSAGNAFIKSRIIDIAEPLLQGNVELADYGNYSAFFANQDPSDVSLSTAAFGMVVLKDDLSPASTGSAKIRFLHFGVGVPEVDLYFSIDPPTTSLTSLAYATAFPEGVSIPVTPNAIAPPVEVGFSSMPVGTYNYVVRSAGGEDDLLKGTVKLDEGRVYTVVIRGFETAPEGVSGRNLGITTIVHDRLAY